MHEITKIFWHRKVVKFELIEAARAGERSFRDFFRLLPTKENRRQSVDPAG
jgi:hypothetical protein